MFWKGTAGTVGTAGECPGGLVHVGLAWPSGTAAESVAAGIVTYANDPEQAKMAAQHDDACTGMEKLCDDCLMVLHIEARG